MSEFNHQGATYRRGEKKKTVIFFTFVVVAARARWILIFPVYLSPRVLPKQLFLCALSRGVQLPVLSPA